MFSIKESTNDHIHEGGWVCSCSTSFSNYVWLLCDHYHSFKPKLTHDKSTVFNHS